MSNTAPGFEHPRVGIGVMIFKNGKILLGKRKGAHGSGEYAFPGGHLEHGETFAHCATRETTEETAMVITNIRFQVLANVLEYAPRHYVHINLAADWAGGEPLVTEPEKCESWGWYSLDELPKPLFGPTQTAIDCHLSGRSYLDPEQP